MSPDPLDLHHQGNECGPELGIGFCLAGPVVDFVADQSAKDAIGKTQREETGEHRGASGPLRCQE